MLLQTYKEHYSKTLKLAIPVCISQLGHIMVGVADTAMVGHLGYHEQAAVQLSNSLYTLFLVFGLGVSIGMTPLIASASSKGNTNEVASLLKNSFIVNLALAFLLFIVLFFCSPVLNLFGQDAHVTKLAIPFLNVMMLSLVPLAIYSTFKQFAEGLSDTTMAMFISVGCNALNVLLNYLLIYGHWGFPEMGMMGSCWASFIARSIMALIMLLYVVYNKKFHSYISILKITSISKTVCLRILSIGLPSALQWIFEIGAFGFAVIMVGWISAKAQAAHSIALNLAAATYMVASGLSAAAAVRVGNFHGTKDVVNVKKAGFSALHLVIVFEMVTAILFLIFKDKLPLLFTHDTEVVAIASELLIIAALFQLSDGIQVIGLGALRGVEDVNIPTIITLVAYWVITLPLCYVLGFTFDLGANGVWYGLLIGLSISALLLTLRFYRISSKVVS